MEDTSFDITFVHRVMRHFESYGRDLPWRKGINSYHVLVSEMMLQQTGVERVIPKYQEFTKKFPTLSSLAKASLPKVLLAWQGLGYNRRAKFLHDTSRDILSRHKGHIPRDLTSLEKLPGIGHYTARAIAIFAFNRSEVCIETNIRTVFLYHYFPFSKKVPDSHILSHISRLLLVTTHLKISPREWYNALMDYGAHLKESGVRVNKKSSGYRSQKRFEGSHRQVRGAVLRELLKHPRKRETLPYTPEDIARALSSLEREGIITHSRVALQARRSR